MHTATRVRKRKFSGEQEIDYVLISVSILRQWGWEPRDTHPPNKRFSRIYHTSTTPSGGY